MTTSKSNPLGLRGISWVELASPEPERLHALLLAFGFSRVAKHATRGMDAYRQGEMIFVLHRGSASVSAGFARVHGPSIPAMGWRCDEPVSALAMAVTRGAREVTSGVDMHDRAGRPVGAIEGIGGSLLYLVEDLGPDAMLDALGFEPHDAPVLVQDKGFVSIDHLTNNVHKGTMARWAGFYREVFGFTEVRYFDVRGAKTGLTSFALRSPCGTFCIPINEASEAKSQINEFLDEYRGPGVQHLAFATRDILQSLRALEGSPIAFLDIEENYYAEVFDRVPNVREDRAELAARNVLIDGDDAGYLLQIFTRNLIGPIFIELIQRENHQAFGEGNFGALFRSIERDQARRGVFDEVTL